MTQPFIGQLAVFSFSFAPKGWALCNGQTLPISQNQALYSLLGTRFGGDGQSTFGLPNLQGNLAVGGQVSGQSISNMGATGGEAQHQLTSNETPLHFHNVQTDATTAAASNQPQPGGRVLGQAQTTPAGGQAAPLTLYATSGPSGATLDQSAVGGTGGQPHPNTMPSLGLNYCISLGGFYPTRS